MLRVVIDANILISGLFWTGLPRQVYQAAFAGEFTVLTTQALLDELQGVLGEEKFRARFAMSGTNVHVTMLRLQALAQRIEPAAVPLHAVRDPKDRAVLACAVGGQADCVVSGDKDLLVLGVYETIPILNASQFLKLLAVE